MRTAIDRVDLEALPIQARLHLRAEGVGLDGELLSIEQYKRVTLGREGGVWRILSDPPTPMRVIGAPKVHFVDETQIRGLWFQHEMRPIDDADGQPQKYVFGSGVAATDVDDDGWTDVFLLSGDRIELFLNRRGHFVNATQKWGLGPQPGGVLTMALPFDFDNDGRKDLFVGAEDAQPLLFQNHGGRFEPVEHSGLVTSQRTISANAADFDGDGLVDLFLANHENVFRKAPNPPGNANNARADQLFLNNGNGSFRDVTREAGVGNTGWSLSPAAADYDLDGDVDFFVGNDFGRDRLYRNDGAGRFTDVTEEAGITRPVASMSADWGDFDGDGDFDLFVGGMRSGSAWVLEAPDFRIARVPRIVDLMFRPYVREAVRSWFRGNRFYENLGDGRFREIARESGTQDSGWAWGSVWLDFDNDGRLDIYGANGFLSGPLEDDT